MKSFYEFYRTMKLREENEIAGADEMPMDKASGMGDEPLSSTGPNEDKALEDIGNAVRRVLEEKVYPAVEKKHVSKEGLMKLLDTISAEIANKFGISQKPKDQEGAMTTNSEPESPAPEQPTAQG